MPEAAPDGSPLTPSAPPPPPHPDIDAVLFDFGGVLIGSPFDRVRALADELAVTDPRAFTDLVFGPYHEDSDHPWHRMERGEIEFGAYFAHLQAGSTDLGIELDLGAFAHAFGALPVHPHMVELVVEVRAAGFRTAMVTNNIVEGREQWRRIVPPDAFDVIVDSSAEGVRKPDPRIYELALDRLGGVAAERAVFLDDAPGNVAGAARVGLRTIHVRGEGHQAAHELRTLLGLDNAPEAASG